MINLGDFVHVNVALKRGASANYADQIKVTPLHYAGIIYTLLSYFKIISK